MRIREARMKPLLGLLLTAGCAAPLHAQDAAEWGFYSASKGATRYSPLAQIDESNVGRLRVVWRHKQADPAILAANPDLNLINRYMVTPIYVDGRLYVPNGFGLTEAIDPKAGTTLWTQKPLIDGVEGLPSLMISKGVAYWGRGDEARILTVRQQHLFALNPKTGAPIASFGDDGKVELSTEEFRYKWNGVPVVAGDVVVLGSSMLEQDSAVYKDGPPGFVRAFDVRTGALRWSFSPVPRAGDPATASWQDEGWKYSGAGNVWSTFSVDEELGLVYVPTSGVTNDMYGGHRLGNNLYGSSVVALNAKTGERVWHFQTVHHDLFDYDLPAAPVLIDITVDGRPIKALAQVTKHGFLFVLDRATGVPVWPIEERPVPKSTVPGEVASPTQPHPTKPPPYEHQGLTEKDLIDFTPALRAEALEIVKRYVIGPPFTPPSVIGTDKVGTIQLPGASGGANWNGGAFDPETGMFYVGSRTRRVRRRLVRAGSRALGSTISRRYARDHERPARSAADEAAVRPHHGVRSEPRRASVDGAERRRAAKSSRACRARICRRSATRRRRPSSRPRRCCSSRKPTRARRARRRTSAARSSRRSTRRPARRSGRSTWA